MNIASLKSRLLLCALIVLLFGFAGVFAGAEVGKPAPELSGQSWLNSKPLKLGDLKGKVVLVGFWTFGCFNCPNVRPSTRACHRKYGDKGLVATEGTAPESGSERPAPSVET